MPRPAWSEVAPLIDAHFGPGAEVVAVMDAGAYSQASRWTARLGDGTPVFVKCDRADRARVAREADFGLRELGSFHPIVRAWLPPESPGGIGVLVTEDLSAARWGIPLERRDARALRATLDAIECIEAPHDLPAVETGEADPDAARWVELADRRDEMLATGLFDAAWLDSSLATLATSAAAATEVGTGLVHGDTWRQNWCTAARGAVLVDWTGAARGNPDVNAAWGEAGVRACGGPGGIVLPAAHPDHDSWAAWMAGLTMRFLVQDLPRRATRPALWATQVRECHAALLWACDALGLESPTPAPGVLPVGPWQP